MVTIGIATGSCGPVVEKVDGGFAVFADYGHGADTQLSDVFESEEDADETADNLQKALEEGHKPSERLFYSGVGG